MANDQSHEFQVLGKKITPQQQSFGIGTPPDIKNPNLVFGQDPNAVKTEEPPFPVLFGRAVTEKKPDPKTNG